MATLKTQYKNFLSDNPDSPFSFEGWVAWKAFNMEIPPASNGLRPLDEYACSLGGGADLFNPDATLIDSAEKEPYVSDDFQIGPNGAYEHSDRETNIRKTMAQISVKLLKVTYDNGDISDIGNEIGIAVGEALENLTESEVAQFIFGFKHGVSLTNGTH